MNIKGLQFPDKCPKDCYYINDFRDKGQSALCRYCPVFCCKLNPAESDDELPWRLLEPDDIREDWLKEWYEFFQTNKEPRLKL